MNNSSRKYNNNLNILGDKIRYYREKRKLSQADLSAQLELLGIPIPKNSIQRMECNDRIIKDYELGAIFKILNISVDSLYKDYLAKIKKS